MGTLSENQFEKIKTTFDLQKENSKKISQTSYFQRKTKLKKLLNLIYEKSNDIEKAIYKDFSKPAAEVKLTEIYSVTAEIKHALRNLKKWMSSHKVPTPITFFGSSSSIVYESKRMALIISPWNFPFMLPLTSLVSAIAAGSCVIIKPSELSKHTSELIKSMMKEIFEENEVAVFTGDYLISQYLASLPFGHIFFTGSTSVGKKIMEAASPNLSSVTLELGGKSPVIIDKSANIREAAKRIAWGKFFNAGQTCVAPDYLLVEENIKDKFVLEFKIAVKNLYGDVEKINTSSDYCRIINKTNTIRLIELLKSAVSDGAVIELGGESDEEDKFVQPTLLTNVNINSQIMNEEIFGPILPLFAFKKEDEITETINKNPNPLALYIFSKNRNFMKNIISLIPAGGVSINDVVVHFNNVNLPFGGTNTSGIGKAHGYSGFKVFSNEKPIMKQPALAISTLLYPPYNKTVNKLIDLTVKYF